MSDPADVPSLEGIAPVDGVDLTEDRPTEASTTETLRVLEETLHVSKRDIVTGTVRVSLRTEVVQETADVTLDRTVAEVTRVPVGRLIDAPPSVRTEGDVTIVPVFEERYVMVKQLYLTEELHIRHDVQQVTSHTVVPLRRQSALIERLDVEGRSIVEGSDGRPDRSRAAGASGGEYDGTS